MPQCNSPSDSPDDTVELDHSHQGSRPGPPTLDRMYAVAAGLDQWTDEERAWLVDHPDWIEYERQTKEAIAELDSAAARNRERGRSLRIVPKTRTA